MPLPIAIGGASLSSEQLRKAFRPSSGSPAVAASIREDGDDKNSGQPYQSVSWAVCPQNEWQARTVVSFYDDDNRNRIQRPRWRRRDEPQPIKKKRMVEIRVQISPLTSAFSSKAFRETRYHLELLTNFDEEGDGEDKATNGGEGVSSSSNRSLLSDLDSYTDCTSRSKSSNRSLSHQHQTPQVVFSADRKHLMVLVFHPESRRKRIQQKGLRSQSSLILFQLRAPKTTTNDSNERSAIPLPPYIVTTKSEHSDDLSTSPSSPSGASTNAKSPVVATHPKFVPCWGVTTVCRLGGGTDDTFYHGSTAQGEENQNNANAQQQHQQPNSLSTTIFLAVRSDGTLLWVDTQSVRVTATARLPSALCNDLVFGCIKASPISTLEKGILALVVTSSSSPPQHSTTSTSTSSQSSGTSLSDNDVEDDDIYGYGNTRTSEEDHDEEKIRRGDCVLVKWSLVSATPVQKTFLRRASTGNVSFQSDSDWDQQNENKRFSQTKRSEGLTDSLTKTNETFEDNMNPLQRMLGNLNKQQNIAAAMEEKEEQLRRKQHMDQFVLQQLKKKDVGLKSGTFSSPSSSSPFLHRRGGEKTAHLVKPPPSPRSSRSLFSRRSSGTTDSMNSESGCDMAMPNIQKSMQVKILSVWSPPSLSASGARNQYSEENSKAIVGDVCFGSIPSILCVVYHESQSAHKSSPFSPVKRVGQILAIEKRSNGNSCELLPVVSLYLSSEQVAEAPSVSNYKTDILLDCMSSLDESSYTESIEKSEISTPEILPSQMIGIEHDPFTDSFVINAIFNGDKKMHWVGCAWDWRSNAIGWMIQQEIASLNLGRIGSDNQVWARLYCGRDPCNGGGSYLIYINSSQRYDVNYDGVDLDASTVFIVKNEKRTIPMAILSPTNSMNTRIFTERCSLLLAKDHISFPSVSRQDSNTTMRKIGWKISALPLSYVKSHGAPQIAAISPSTAKSIAVASACGVCVLDTQKGNGNKWKQFGTPSEEVLFSTIAMTWWEGSPDGVWDDEKDDLLVAVTETKNGEQFLSCWSSKRLDLMHQLLDTPDLEWKPGESQDPEPSFGIPLPKDIKVTNISLLPQPQNGLSRRSGDPRKAVVLVYSPDLEIECEFLVLRLQVFRNKVPSSHAVGESYVARRPFYVMAHTALRASMKHDKLPGSVTSAFIAGASFKYDLTKSAEKKSNSNIGDNELLVTLGLNRTSGGMYAYSAFEHGNLRIASLSNLQVSKYQLSDIVVFGAPSDVDLMPVVKFVWNIELLNGDLVCWSVPSSVAPKHDQIDDYMADLSIQNETNNQRTPGVKGPKGLRPPFFVCDEKCTNKNERLALGTLCEVGSVSDWAFQSSSGCQTDISLGVVPQSGFGCVLRSGQKSQKFARSQIGDIGSGLFSSNLLDMNTYSQSVFVITPPAFVISLYALLLEAASIRMDSGLESLIDKKRHLKVIEGQVQSRLTSEGNADMSMMALRLIIFRSLEMITKMHRRYTKDPSNSMEFNLLLSQSLLAVVVNAVRECTTNLRFASLLLEVGRQTEPGNLQFLFPLPLPDKNIELKHIPNKFTARSAIDLFTICMNEGSLAASASALPLLTSKDQARYYCGLLLDEAIHNFIQNTKSTDYNFDKTEEERRALGDFCRFGMKLEDAECFEEKLVTENQEKRTGRDSNSVDTMDRSSSNQSLILETPEMAQRNLICTLNASSSILNYIVPSTIKGETEKQREEDAIRREATTFISKSLDDPALDFAMLPNWDENFDSQHSNGAEITNIASLVGDALLGLIQEEQADNNWKAISAISKMILQEGADVLYSFDLFVEMANKSQPLDILSMIPESYDVNNGIEENLTKYIEEEINSSSAQINDHDAETVVDLALLLIQRIHTLPLADIADQALMEVGLVIIVMVGCDIMGRSAFIQDMLDQDCILNKCYKDATTAGKETVPTHAA
ncbi:unnamed protein product [Pseudo-nitzschia multistriata]|uniref:Uncharacterized protein n=1 Tax=Pseudo-nitzschia multistriata TaxID=183589 RepID=A0A448Z9K8_9STRA|nr:unnamed protein product [Pseudo-nitzschia multistriata]